MRKQSRHQTHPCSLRSQRQAGVGLLEILITVLVIAIGLLGMASLQLSGLRANHDAYYRSQASILVADLADRMRANLDAARTGAYAFNGVPVDPGYDCRTSFPAADSCTGAELAAADLFDWHENLTDPVTGLPVAQAAVACDTCVGAAPGAPYSITLAWDENRDGVLSGLPDDPVMTVELVP